MGSEEDIVYTATNQTQNEMDILKKIWSQNPFNYIYEKTNLLIVVATLNTILLFIPYIQYIPILNLLLKPLVFSTTVLWIVNALLLLLSFTNPNFSYINLGPLTQIIILIVIGVTSILYYTLISPQEEDLTKEKLLEIKADYGNVMSEYLNSKNIPSENYNIVSQEYEIFQPFKIRTTQKIKSIKNLKEKANILYNFRPSPQHADERVIEPSLFIQSFNVIKTIDSKLKTLGWTQPSILSALPDELAEALENYDDILEIASEITNNMQEEQTKYAHVKKQIKLAINNVKLLKKLGDQENSEGNLDYATSLYSEIFNKLKSIFCQKKPTDSDLSWSTIKSSNKLKEIRTLLSCSNNEDLFSQKFSSGTTNSLQDLMDKL